jgi:hypothetical protein
MNIYFVPCAYVSYTEPFFFSINLGSLCQAESMLHPKKRRDKFM